MTVQQRPMLALDQINRGHYPELEVQPPLAQESPITAGESLAQLATVPAAELILPTEALKSQVDPTETVDQNSKAMAEAGQAISNSNEIFRSYKRTRQEATARLRVLNAEIPTLIEEKCSLEETNQELLEDTAQAETDKAILEQSLRHKRKEQADIEIVLANAQDREEKDRNKSGHYDEQELTGILIAVENGQWTSPDDELKNLGSAIVRIIGEITKLENRAIPAKKQQITDNVSTFEQNEQRLIEIKLRIEEIQAESDRLRDFESRAKSFFTLAADIIAEMGADLKTEMEKVSHDSINS